MYLSYNTSDDQYYACKIIEREKMPRDSYKLIQNEIAIQGQISSPFVVKFRQTVDEFDTIYLFTELCNGGNLREFLEAREWKMPPAVV